MSNLSEDQREKIANLHGITSIPEDVCERVLQANGWDLQIALNRVLDGDLTHDNIDQPHPSSTNSSSSTSASYPSAPPLSSTSSSTPSAVHQSYAAAAASSLPSSELRRRNLHSGSSSEGPRNDGQVPGDDESNNNGGAGGLIVSIWSHIPWIIRLPFTIFFSATQIFYDFITSIINPTLYYDSTGTVQRFIAEFETQYGSTHPAFSPETYTNVIAKAKRDLRFALIYIHSPIHRDTERFCRTVIATERFSQFISTENLIFWSCNSFFPDGYAASQAVSFTSYPFLFLIGLKNGKMTILKTFEGFQSLDLLSGRIKNTIDNNEVHLISARMDKETNIVNSLIRQQQDAALEESLRKDQEKERKAREEEEAKAEVERQKRAEEEQEARRFESIMELKVTLLSDLVDEPEVSHGEAIKLLFRLPSGKRLERRFLKSHPVKQLYYFVFCNDESLINFKLKTNFPTKELPGHSPIPEVDRESDEMNRQLSDCELENNIVLFVHDLDA